MTAPETADWFERNDAYLAAVLMQLRHRLNAAAPPPAIAPAATGAAPRAEPRAEPRRGLFGRFGAEAAEPAQILLAAPAPVALAVEQQRLAAAVAEAGAIDPPPALVALAQRFGLTDFEREILELCVAVELDPGIAAAIPTGQPSFGLAMTVLGDPAWEVVAPDRPLRHWRLVEVDRDDGRPLTGSPLRIDERILNFAKGLDHLDARLAAMLQPAPAPPAALPASQQAAVAAVAAALAHAPAQVAMLRGVDRASKAEVAAAAAAAAGLRLHRLAADALPLAVEDIDSLARLWHREALLAPRVLLIDAHDADRGADGAARRVARFVGRSGGPLIIDTRGGLALPIDVAADVEVARPTAAEQVAEWIASLAGSAEISEGETAALARTLAGRFDLGRRAITLAAAAARDDSADAPLAERLLRATLARTRPDLALLAERIDAKAGFDDIVLPAAQERQLRQLVAQVEHRVTVIDDWGFGARMNRGLGVSALFAGDSGTGKTMAAEVVARALGLDLYRIDLAAVVSKYIGETEKNLGALFDAADAGGAVLFFDEADALFGKRSEVKEAHDRFANIEIDYLLQRMEGFSGLAILATNLKSALDPAFIRRLRFIVDFPYPGVDDRQRIWDRALPAATPAEGIDTARLARLDLTGAAIHAVALNAAFLAAAAGGKVTMPLLMEAGRAEFRKLGRPINEADFRMVRAADFALEAAR